MSKFKVGEDVIVISDRSKVTIAEISHDGIHKCLDLEKGTWQDFNESELRKFKGPGVYILTHRH